MGPVIKQFEEAKRSLEDVKSHHNNLYVQLKAKTAEQSVVKEDEEKYKAEMNEVKEKEDAKRSDLPSLYKEKAQVMKEMNEIRAEQGRIREEYNKQRQEHYAYQRYLRELRQAECQEKEKARQEERARLEKEREEEEAKRDPWEEEKVCCEQLILYVEKYMPKKEEAKAEAAALSVPAGVVVVGKGGKDDDDDEAALMALKGKKGKRKGAAASKPPAAAPKKSSKIQHAIENFGMFEKLGLKPPTETSECPELYKQLLEKREWLKTAPPKQKKSKKEEAVAPAAEPPAADEAKEMRGGLHKFDPDEVDVEGGDGTADDLMDAFGFGSDDGGDAPAEAADAPAEPPAGDAKEMRGGLHKFDQDEVDVEGGDATADDLMDAFGFGGDEDDAPAEAADAPAEPPAEAKEMRGGLHKFDPDEVDVEGGDATADD